MSWLIFLIFLLLKKLELFVCSTFPSTCFQGWEVETGLKNVKRLTTVEQPSEGPCGFSTWLTFAPSCHIFFRLAKISHPLSFFFFSLPLGSLTLVKFLARNPVKRLQKSASVSCSNLRLRLTSYFVWIISYYYWLLDILRPIERQIVIVIIENNLIIIDSNLTRKLSFIKYF